MAWRSSEQEFLIQGRSYPVHLSMSVNRVKLPDGTLLNSAHEYFRVSADGNLVEWYRGLSSSTLEECLYVINIHAVLQTSLVEFTWTECYGREPELQQRICLSELEPIADDGLPFDLIKVVERFHLLRTDKPNRDE